MSEQTLSLFEASQYQFVAGVDEVGRGCLAGPVFAAAVILDPARPIAGLRDSKKLSEAHRQQLSVCIKEQALCWAIGSASNEEIDQINILQATFLAMRRAVEGLKVEPDFIQVDGNRLPKWPWMSEAIVKGDDKIAAISAASILAKTARDELMRGYAKRFPGYDFEHNVGYGTARHLQGLKTLGPTPIHQMTFEPLKSLFESDLFSDDQHVLSNHSK